MGQAIGLLVELAIAQFALLGGQGNGIRRAPHLRLEQRVQRLLRSVGPLRGVGQQLLAFIRCQYWQLLH
ncbi:hypothetical protein D3C76_246810 [compost metagenome]